MFSGLSKANAIGARTARLEIGGMNHVEEAGFADYKNVGTFPPPPVKNKLTAYPRRCRSASDPIPRGHTLAC